ncbi:MAG: hypothetical protein RJA19_803 [Bacteroidota bacterium]|jgi:FKBP-type peptidyl-prolyl cis-trans isomerase FklB
MMRSLLIAALCAVCVSPYGQLRAQTPINMTELSYAFGVLFSANLQQEGIEGIDAAALSAGFSAYAKGVATMTPEEANASVGAAIQQMREAKDAAYKASCEAFLAENKSKPGVQVTASGLQYIHLVEGKGASPSATSQVTVHYAGTLIDGTEFDSSYKRGEPITFGLNQVIPGWTEGLQLMKAGGKTRFFIPQEIAYGARPNPQGPIPPYAALVFEVELISFE